MSLLPLVIVAWAVIIPAVVVGLFGLRKRSAPAPALALARSEVSPATTEEQRACEARQRQPVMADSRRFLRHHG